MRGGRRRRLGSRVPLVAAGLLLVACAGTTATPEDDASTTAVEQDAPGTSDEVPDPDDIDPARLAPLEAMGPCPTQVPDAATTAPEDLPLPPAAVVATSTTDGTLRSVQGFSARTPVEIMVAYLRLDDWTTLEAEDEVFEAELVLEHAGVRLFVKAQASCARGSAFVMHASTDADEVPEPAREGRDDDAGEDG